jgi:hypothetical protein
VLRSGGTALLFLTPALDGAAHPAALPPEKQPRVPTEKYPGQSRRYGEENNTFPFPGTESQLPGRPARSLVPTTTELYTDSSIILKQLLME